MRRTLVLLPALVLAASRVSAQESETRASASRASDGWIASLRSGDAAERIAACRALGALRLAAREAAPYLADEIKRKDSPARTHATLALGSILESADDERKRLEDSGAPMEARNDLSRFLADTAASIVADLADAILSADEEMRIDAAVALASLREDSRPAVPALLQAFKGASPLLHFHIVRDLGRAGPTDASALPVLLRASEFGNADDRQNASFGLRNLGGHLGQAVPAIKKLFKDERRDTRANAALVARGMGRIAKDLVPDLLEMLDDPSPDQREWACYALEPIIEDMAKAAQPPEADAARGIPFEERAATMQVSEAALDKVAQDALPNLIRALSDSDVNVVWHAARAISNLGGRGDPARAALLDAVQRMRGDPQQDVSWALLRIAPFGWSEPVDDAVAVRALVVALGTGNPHTRVNILRSLAGLRGAVDALVPALVARLKDENADVRTLAAEVLETTGQDGRSAVPALLARLAADDDEESKSAIASAIGAIDPSAIRGSHVLLEMLERGAPIVKKRSFLTILRADETGDRAVKAVAAFLRDYGNRLHGTELEIVAAHVPRSPEIAGALLDLLRRSIGADLEVLVNASARAGATGDAIDGALEHFVAEGHPVFGLEEATRLLGARRGGSADGVVPALVKRLGSPDRDARITAAEELTKIGPGAAAAVHALLTAYLDVPKRSESEKDADPGERVSGIPSDVDEVARERCRYLDALAAIGKGARAALPDLVRSYAAGDRIAKRELRSTLASIAPEDPGVQRAVLEGLDSQDQDDRTGAISAVAALGPNMNVEPLLVKVMDGPGGAGRREAAEALKKLGARGEAYLARLRKALDERDEYLVDTAIAVLGSIPAEKRVLSEGSLKLLGAADVYTFRSALASLTESPPPVRETTVELARILETSADRNERLRAAFVLGQEDGALGPEVLALVQALGPDRNLSLLAICALARQGSAAAPAVPKLVEIVRGASVEDLTGPLPCKPIGDMWSYLLCETAVAALGFIGPAAKDAVPDLEAAVKKLGAATPEILRALDRIHGFGPSKLALAVDPGLAADGNGLAKKRERPAERPLKDMDGSYLVQIDDGPAAAGNWVELHFAFKNGIPAIFAAAYSFEAGGSRSDDARATLSGTATVVSADWLTVAEIRGTFSLETAERSIQGSFAFENPFLKK